MLSNATMPHEVACVDISPLGGQEDGKASFCAIGLWTEISVSVLKLPSLQQVDNQLLGGGTCAYVNLRSTGHLGVV